MDAIIGTGKISRREYEIIVEQNVGIPMSDGVLIDVDIFRPKSEGKFPAFVGLSPFNKEIQSMRIWPAATRSRRIHGIPDAVMEAGPIEFFVQRGYVYVIGSVRGTGRSGGSYSYQSTREVKDVYEVIEWVARQKWCDGNVGMIGMGYFAQLQLLVASLQPPSLKAIAPIGAFFDNYRDFWWQGGILLKGFARWLVSPINFDVHTEESSLLREFGEEGFKKLIHSAIESKDIAANHEMIEALKNPHIPPNANYIDIILHSNECSYWQERSPDYGKIKVPLYLGAASHRPGPFNHWHEFKVPKKLIFFPPSYTDRPFYQLSWELLRWFDYWLKGIDTGIMNEPDVKLFVRGSNDWIFTNDFPIPGTRFIPFYLHENHMLCELEPWYKASSSSYEDAPGKRGSVEFFSPPMVENMEIAGPILLKVYASCRGYDMNLIVSLWDVDEGGSKVRLTEGLLKASHMELDADRSRPWYAYHTFKNPKMLVPGRVYPLVINLNPTCNLFKPGHRIMLKISSSDETPETLFHVGFDHLLSQSPNTISIYHSEEYPSFLFLPITKGNIVGTYISGGDISLKSKEFMKIT